MLKGVFSAMNFVKNKLRDSMGDQYLNNCLVTFIEKEFFPTSLMKTLSHISKSCLVELICNFSSLLDSLKISYE